MARSHASANPVIRVVPDTAPEPLTIDELQKSGNAMAKELRRGAFMAMQRSMNDTYLERTYTVRDVRRMQQQAQEAAEAWQQVGAMAAELLDQVQRAKEAHQ